MRSRQWRLRGEPWSGQLGTGSGADMRSMVRQLAGLMRELHWLGWTLVASADISAKKEDGFPMDTHSWFWLSDTST